MGKKDSMDGLMEVGRWEELLGMSKEGARRKKHGSNRNIGSRVVHAQ